AVLARLAGIALPEALPPAAGEKLARARQIASLDPTPFGRHIELDIVLAQGDAALAERDATRAHGFFLEALQADPKRAELHAKIAAAHRAIGNLESAITSYDRAIALGAGVDT